MHGRMGKKKKRGGKHSVVSQKVIHDLVSQSRLFRKKEIEGRNGPCRSCVVAKTPFFARGACVVAVLMLSKFVAEACPTMASFLCDLACLHPTHNGDRGKVHTPRPFICCSNTAMQPTDHPHSQVRAIAYCGRVPFQMTLALVGTASPTTTLFPVCQESVFGSSEVSPQNEILLLSWPKRSITTCLGCIAWW